MNIGVMWREVPVVCTSAKSWTILVRILSPFLGVVGVVVGGSSLAVNLSPSCRGVLTEKCMLEAGCGQSLGSGQRPRWSLGSDC